MRTPALILLRNDELLSQLHTTHPHIGIFVIPTEKYDPVAIIDEGKRKCIIEIEFSFFSKTIGLNIGDGGLFKIDSSNTRDFQSTAIIDFFQFRNKKCNRLFIAVFKKSIVNAMLITNLGAPSGISTSPSNI